MTSKMRPELKSATPELVHAFYKGAPPFSLRGFAAVLGGTPIALGGVYMDGEHRIAFLELKDEMRLYKRELIRFINEGKRVLSGYSEVLAVASTKEKTARTLLNHFNFRLFTHTPDGREVYRWVR